MRAVTTDTAARTQFAAVPAQAPGGRVKKSERID